jgi:N-dimethylarginine dimethylaminohydrolase
MATPLINQTVLMSGVDYFSDDQPINPYMSQQSPINRELAAQEHAAIAAALTEAGVKIIKVAPPTDCQDGVYTANWALVRGDKAVMASLPAARSAEEAYARQVLTEMGKTIYHVPEGLHYSGQGDSLPCGDYLLAGSGYRTDAAVHQFLAETLGYTVITLQTVPLLDNTGQPVINASSGWPDSFFYDLDIAVAVLRSDLIAWCPEAFMPESQVKIRELPMEKIEVSLKEATEGFACNLVSTGEAVVMSAHAPELQAAIEGRGLRTITPQITELLKGGGYIRCTTLTLDN